MIIQHIYLEDWDWHVTVYYAVDSYYSEEILEELDYIGCSTPDLIEADKLFENNKYNFGLTHSSFRDKCTVMVIGLTTSSEEFQNTLDHEKGHLVMHIAEAYNIDPYGEEYQYLSGEVGQKLFKVAKRFLCDHCRRFLKEEIQE